MAKMFLEAAEACLAENKTKPAKCDALAKKARKHMDGAIAAAETANAQVAELRQRLGR